jgi:hypothetical protein
MESLTAMESEVPCVPSELSAPQPKSSNADSVMIPLLITDVLIVFIF